MNKPINQQKRNKAILKFLGLYGITLLLTSFAVFSTNKADVIDLGNVDACNQEKAVLQTRLKSLANIQPNIDKIDEEFKYLGENEGNFFAALQADDFGGAEEIKTAIKEIEEGIRDQLFELSSSFKEEIEKNLAEQVVKQYEIALGNKRTIRKKVELCSSKKGCMECNNELLELEKDNRDYLAIIERQEQDIILFVDKLKQYESSISTSSNIACNCDQEIKETREWVQTDVQKQNENEWNAKASELTNINVELGMLIDGLGGFKDKARIRELIKVQEKYVAFTTEMRK